MSWPARDPVAGGGAGFRPAPAELHLADGLTGGQVDCLERIFLAYRPDDVRLVARRDDDKGWSVGIRWVAHGGGDLGGVALDVLLASVLDGVP